jgi:hypothetical protein
MKGVILTAMNYGVRESTIRKFTNLGGANAFHLVASCFKDEGPGLKRLGSLWQGMCQPDLPPQTSAWPRPRHPDDDAVMLHCFLVKFYTAFGLLRVFKMKTTAHRRKKNQGDLSYSLAGVVSLAFGPIPKAPLRALG